MRTINLTIQQQTLTLNSLESLPVQGSDNSVKLAFAFDESWNNYPTRRAYFQYYFSNWKYVELSADNEVLVPRDFLAKPGFKVMIRGYAQSGAIMATNIENVPVEFAPSLADSTEVVPVEIRSGDEAISVEQEGDVVTISLNDEFESNKFVSAYTIRGTAQGEIIFLDGVLLGTTEKSFADFKSIYNQIVIPYEFTIGATTYHDTLVATETRYNAQNAYYVADLLPLGQNYTAIVTIYLDGTSVKAVIACLPFTLNNSFDNAPTSGSTKLVNSGAVYSAIENVKTLLRAYSDANLATAKSYADGLLVESKQYTDNKYNSLVGIITHETEVMEARITSAITQMQNQVNASITGMETTIQGELTALDQRVDEAISTMNTTISTSLTNMENTIQQELANLDTRFSTLQTALEARITTLSNQINSQFSTLQTQLEGRIDTLEGEVDDKLSEADEAIAILNGYNERLTKVEGTYVTKIELYEALKRGEISSEVEKVYTSEINYITDNLMPSGKVTKILGKTEKSENLIVQADIAERTSNGVTYKYIGGVLYLNGTATGNGVAIILNTGEQPIGEYTESNSFTGTISTRVDFSVRDSSQSYIKGVGNTYSRNNTFTTTTPTTMFHVYIPSGCVLTNVVLLVSLVKGSTAPTTWTQGYEGLKHTHITGLKSTKINLWNQEWEVGTYDEGVPNPGSNNMLRSKYPNKIEVDSSLPIYFKTAGWTMVIHEYDVNGSFLESVAVRDEAKTLNPLCDFVRFRMQDGYGTTYNHDICINFSNPTINGNYYPYEEDTLEVEANLNEYDYIDVEEKKQYVQTSVEKTITGANVNSGIQTAQGSGALFVYTNINITDTYIAWSEEIGVCDNPNIKVKSLDSSWIHNNSIGVIAHQAVALISIQGLTTQQEYIDYLNAHPIHFVYKLATPIVTDVDVQNDGWIDNLIQGGSITQQVDTTDTTALIAKEVDIAVNVVVENQ